MQVWPSKKQWKNWSLPSKLTAIGTLAGIISLLFTVIPYSMEFFLKINTKDTEAIHVAKNELDIWIWHYPDSHLPEGELVYARNKQAATDLKRLLSDHGFHNIMVTSTHVKPLKTIIKHVNNVPESMLSEINIIVSKQLSLQEMSAVIVKGSNESVGYKHPSVSIELGLFELNN